MNLTPAQIIFIAGVVVFFIVVLVLPDIMGVFDDDDEK